MNQVNKNDNQNKRQYPILNRACLTCGSQLRGRADKRFCDDYCRSAHNNQRNAPARPIMQRINTALRTNRQILRDMLGDRKTVKVSQADLLNKGFDFHYITHFQQSGEATEYSCYEFSYKLGGGICEIYYSNEEPFYPAKQA